MAGRKCKYNPDLHIPMIYILAKTGYTQKEISNEFKIDDQTLQNWMEKDPKFRLSWEDGRANCIKFIETQLYKLCTPHTTTVKVRNNSGHVIKTIEKEVDPNPSAISLYLRLKDETARKNLHQDINIINNVPQIDPEDKDL
jgi:hypothetical protein